jgi:hypothetical protein
MYEVPGSRSTNRKFLSFDFLSFFKAPETITGTVIYNGQTFFLPALLQRPNGVMMNGLTENIEQANLQN